GLVAELLAEEFRAVALAGGHPVETFGDQDAAALGDAERVLRIGRALVENALVHTQPGTPVRISVGDARLVVEDAGQGIAAADAAQVFERFTRLPGSRAAGSGLGLAIARELAEAMGGSLTL